MKELYMLMKRVMSESAIKTNVAWNEMMNSLREERQENANVHFIYVMSAHGYIREIILFVLRMRTQRKRFMRWRKTIDETRRAKERETSDILHYYIMRRMFFYWARHHEAACRHAHECAHGETRETQKNATMSRVHERIWWVLKRCKPEEQRKTQRKTIETQRANAKRYMEHMKAFVSWRICFAINGY